MGVLLANNPAPGGPGIEPRWTRSDKDGVGTAYSSLSRVWFTVSKGILNEVYFPTIDKPQIRDLQYLVTDGESFFHDERQLDNSHEYIAPGVLGFRIVNSDPQGRYRITKEIIADPHQACVLVHTKLEGDEKVLPKLKMFALLAPHLNVGGRGNTGSIVQTARGYGLAANKDGVWLVLSASTFFARGSCGYVGVNDGWKDLAENFKLDSACDCALDGNIALTGEIDLAKGREFVLTLAFGDSLHHALFTAAQAMGSAYDDHRTDFIEQWQRANRRLLPGKDAASGDKGGLFRASHSIIIAHEDKTYNGAIIASLSIPWGEAMSDEGVGGYHLVWTRDMYQSVTGLLAAGSVELPLHALIYLACTQNADGGFPQNFWINGEPYWRGIQLDETAFPVILAWRLRAANALGNFDPYPMVLRAAGYLLENGPVTPQERWEECSGFSPSTLAAQIAALVCAAAFARERQDEATAAALETAADFLEAHVERWTVTTQGSLLAGVPRHFIRIHPASPSDPAPNEDANAGMLQIANQAPGAPSAFPAKDVIDAGFLELVRYGIRQAKDPLIEDSLRVVDAVLKVDTPKGPCWRRYNHDGYGQRADGGPYMGWGMGHAWPVLAGERGHYELAAGRDPKPFINAMEGFASSTKLIPEQVWSLADLPQAHMLLGRPTGGAMPLAWAHAEYLKLVRSATEGKVFDLLPPVADRYRAPRQGPPLEIWKFNRQVRSIAASAAGGTLRVQAGAAFRLHWSLDDWRTARDTEATLIATTHAHADVAIPKGQRAPVRFTFLWTTENRWEGKDYTVNVE